MIKKRDLSINMYDTYIFSSSTSFYDLNFQLFKCSHTRFDVRFTYQIIQFVFEILYSHISFDSIMIAKIKYKNIYIERLEHKNTLHHIIHVINIIYE